MILLNITMYENTILQNEVRCLLAMREGTLISGGGDQLKAWDTRQRLLPLAITDVSKFCNLH